MQKSEILSNDQYLFLINVAILVLGEVAVAEAVLLDRVVQKKVQLSNKLCKRLERTHYDTVLLSLLDTKDYRGDRFGFLYSCFAPSQYNCPFFGHRGTTRPKRESLYRLLSKVGQVIFGIFLEPLHAQQMQIDGLQLLHLEALVVEAAGEL